ncbi:MAG TPA: hypothetical protein PLR01_00820 [Bacteroidales bacterium]|nr:hypothetical protein [Bacteroidales bacterium]
MPKGYLNEKFKNFLAMKTLYFRDCRTLQEVKQVYKKLALLHHPDRGGDTVTMQEINLQYEGIIKDPFFGFSVQQEDVKESFIKFPEIINLIISFNVEIEICGHWVWVGGKTIHYKDKLKEFGFRFSGDKKRWYWRPVEFRSNNREPLPIEMIRKIHGSDVVNKPPQPKKVPEMQISDEMLDSSFQRPPGWNFEDPHVEYTSASFNH